MKFLASEQSVVFVCCYFTFSSAVSAASYLLVTSKIDHLLNKHVMALPILLDYAYVTPARMIGACVLFPLLTILVVILRFFSRLLHKMPLKSDDWLILVSMVWLGLPRFLARND